jgi:DNA-binding beta-propeller fold protein YncE
MHYSHSNARQRAPALAGPLPGGVLLASLVLALLACLTPLAARAAGCNTPTPDPVSFVQVPGAPFAAIASRDGCRIFVTLESGTAQVAPGLAVFTRHDGQVLLERTLALPGKPRGMALSHDGRMLVVADTTNVAFVDVARLIAGAAKPVVGLWSGPGVQGRNYLEISADDHYLFMSDEILGTVTIIDLAQARAADFSGRLSVHAVGVGTSPVGMSLSRDEHYLFVTSQRMTGLGWPQICAEPDASGVAPHPEGAVVVIDLRRALADQDSVVKVAKAGCSPVRIATSAARVYVTARASNSLLIFDEKQLTTMGVETTPTVVPVGKSPVGIHVIDDGRKVVVANSDRFSAPGHGSESISVIDVSRSAAAGASVLGLIPTRTFPRELHCTADERTLLVTNFSAQTLEVVDLASRPWLAASRVGSVRVALARRARPRRVRLG